MNNKLKSDTNEDTIHRFLQHWHVFKTQMPQDFFTDFFFFSM